MSYMQFFKQNCVYFTLFPKVCIPVLHSEVFKTVVKVTRYVKEIFKLCDFFFFNWIIETANTL